MIKHTIKKEKDFVQISNSIFSDSNISLKAKGILALMLSLPESWNFSIGGIAYKCKESRQSISSAIRELERTGYLKRKMIHGATGRIIRMEYEIYEKPCNADSCTENPYPDNTPTENPSNENPFTDEALAELPSPDNPLAENPTTDNPHIDMPSTDILCTENVQINNTITNNKNTIFTNTQSNHIQSNSKISFDISHIAMYRDIIKNNIEYDILAQHNPLQSDRLGEIVELMTEVVCSKKDMMIIARNTYPTQLVKNKFLKINSEHIEYIMECMNKNTTQIANIKQYLLAAIFNAPNTIGSYYRSQVNHDLYG